MTTALVLVDIQNDYFPGGKMELVGIGEASANAARLLGAFREKSLPTFHIQHIFAGADAPFFAEGSEGAEIHSSIAPAAGEKVIRKAHPNSFHGTTLQEDLKRAGVERLVVCGAMSHMCIDATTRAGADLGFQCVLPHDACATRDLEFQGRTVAADEVHASFMSALGWIYAQLATTSEALDGIGKGR